MSGAVQNDLTIPVSMSGAAYLHPGISLTPVGKLPLATAACVHRRQPRTPCSLFSDHGNVYLYQPYTYQPYISNHGGSMNRGTFSIAPDVEDE